MAADLTTNNNPLYDHYCKSDKVMLMINYGLVVYALLLANWHSTWVEAIVVGGATAMALTAISRLSPGTPISRVAMAAGFMVMTALHIHQAQGMIEIHFGVFLLLAVLLYYRDWLPIVIAAAVIAVHHLVFFYLQSNGSGLWLLQTTDQGWWVVFLHACYVVVESALLIWLSLDLKRDALQSTEIMQLTNNILSEDSINLTHRSSGGTSLLQRFDGFTTEVETLAIQVRNAAGQLRSHGQLLTDVTGEMTQSTEVQQRETDMIATALEQMSSAINEVSSNADIAAGAANQVDNNATKATTVSTETQQAVEQLATQVEQAAVTIQSLNDQSNGIGSVLDVIRGVAEQTNLLALNAAIEAARAGEQGRGFAVVADEVRTLAQRTQESTEEIDKMIEALQSGSASAVSAIEESRSHADYCVENTKNSLSLMEDVSGSIKEINTMNAMIATASNEQSQVINEITHNISNILAASKLAATDSQKAAQCSLSLAEVSQTLQSLTCKFEVGEA